MLCWVNNKTKKHIENLNSQFNIPITFTNCFDEFTRTVDPNTFFLTQRKIAGRNTRKLTKLFNTFSGFTFYLFVGSTDSCTTSSEFYFSFVENVIVCDETDIFCLFNQSL